MGYKLHDFKCDDCGIEWEELSLDDTDVCAQCHKTVTKQIICTGNMGGFSIRDADGQRQELLRRSAEHTHKELKKNPEKFGDLGKQRARMGQVRSFGGIPKKD